jgi:hypothetical protein
MIRNYVTGIVEDALASVFGSPAAMRKTSILRARKYREGYQPKRLHVKPPASDDNIIVNFAGLVVERAVSLLFGDGVEIDLPGEGESPADVWLERVKQINKWDEVLNDIADYGATSGTPVVLFDANAIPADHTLYPEIICLDPSYLEIKTDPENYRHILYYKIEYLIEIDKDKRILRRRIIEPAEPSVDGELSTSWKISDFIQEGSRWVEMGSPVIWDYYWPPILAWKNLPNAGSPYGRPDLTDDVLDVQDALNLVASNINKVMRLQAHQRLWGRFLGKATDLFMGPDKVLNIDNEQGHLEAIQANGSFQDMTLFLHELRDAMFAIARSTDPHGLKDRIGQITNFGLRILYKDALDKLKTKRRLYGEALLEIVRRLLELGGFPPDPGKVVWPEVMPIDQVEQVTSDTFELDHNIAARETIQKARGYDPETEDERIEADTIKQNENNANIGSQLLKNFSQGKA